MPKTPDFATWVSRMAGTIEDTSTWVKPLPSAVLTDMQKRALIADLLCPTIETEDEAVAWMSVFCVCVFKDEVSSGAPTGILGYEMANDYYEEMNSVYWVRHFKQKVAKGWFPEDV